MAVVTAGHHSYRQAAGFEIGVQAVAPVSRFWLGVWSGRHMRGDEVDPQERVQQQTYVHDVDVPASCGFQDTVEATTLVPQERAQQQIYEYTAGVPVPPVMEETTEVVTQPVEHTVNVTAPINDLPHETGHDVGPSLAILQAYAERCAWEFKVCREWLVHLEQMAASAEVRLDGLTRSSRSKAERLFEARPRFRHCSYQAIEGRVPDMEGPIGSGHAKTTSKTRVV